MLSLTEEMTRLYFVLNPPAEEGSCVSIQFIGTSRNDGVSTVAREFAMTASRNIEGNVLLVDLNLEGQTQYDQFKTDEAISRFGQPSDPIRLNSGMEKVWDALSMMWVQNPLTPITELVEPLTTLCSAHPTLFPCRY